MGPDDDVVDAGATGSEGGGNEGGGSQEPESLRDTLERVAGEMDSTGGDSTQPGGEDTPSGDDTAPGGEDTQPGGEQAPPQTQQQQQAAPVKDEPPKSWKAGPKAKWGSLDPEVRAEIQRREQDHVKVMNRAMSESASARQFANTFVETLRPYEARIRASGSHPIEMINRFFQADYILSSTSPVNAARYMAELIQSYGIDIKELDNALAGAGPTDPVADRVEQLLAQRLAPLGSFLEQQQHQSRQQDILRAQQADSEVAAMASDPKYPHMETVRTEMADLIDYYAAKGVFLTLDSAYNKAVSLNPELGAQSARRQVMQQAANVNNQTRRALAASASVSGSPGGSPTAGKGNGSLRDSIEAAWNAHSGR